MKKRLIGLILTFILTFSLLPTAGFAAQDATTVETNSKGVWWWSIDDIDNANTDSYLAFCEKEGVTEIYLYCNRISAAASADSVLSYAKVRSFVSRCSQLGIRVAFMAGDVSWIEDASKTAAVMENYLAYQAQAGEQEKFYGVHFDVEPHQSADYKNGGGEERAAVMQKFADNYLSVLLRYKEDGFADAIELDIPFWLDDTYAVTFDGTANTPLLAAIAKSCTTMSLMSYRTKASSIWSCAADELVYAQQYGCKITFGFETGDSGEGSNVDFSAQGRQVFEQVYEQFSTEYLQPNFEGSNASYSIAYGCAIHYMRSWYNMADSEGYSAWQAFDIEGTESPAALDNPERGFYHPHYYDAALQENPVLNPKETLIHLRIGIGAFSHNYLSSQGQAPADYVGGGSIAFTEDFLSALNNTLNNIRTNGGSVILRFAYDNFDGVADMEPSMQNILSHIDQLSPIFAENQDIILAVESGFLGPWGEQHTSALIKSEAGPANIKALADKLLQVVPKPITVSVRRPLYYAYAAGISLSDLATHRAEAGSPYYRLGVYNDGYLGSETDLGTFSDRQMETAWLGYQASHTLYGGEVVANRSTNGIVYNAPAYISDEMFLTHTAYLNSEWNDTVIAGWQSTPYEGDDPQYQGQTAYTYIANHLGYRFVLRSSEYRITPDSLSLRFSIENVGAGNLLKDKDAEILLKTEAGTTAIPVNIDARTWTSQTITIEEVTIPHDASVGSCEVYLRLKDQNANTILFANGNATHQGGNLLGVLGSSAPSEPEAQPFENGEIHSMEDFIAFRERVNGGETTLDAMLMTDLDFGADFAITPDGSATLAGGEIYVPVGTADNPYAGTFTGNGHALSSVYINDASASYQGVFGYTDGATISGVVLANAYCNGDENVGGIVGYARDTVISDCTVENLSVLGLYRTGGIAGYAKYSAISDCSASGSVFCENAAGGIAGYLNQSTLDRCTSSVSVEGIYRTGGIAGYVNTGKIRECRNLGAITGADPSDYTGGIAGSSNEGTIANCENRATIAGDSSIGGIVGYGISGEISACKNTGSVSGAYRVGGIAGYNYAEVTLCENAASVQSDNTAGGIIGYNYGTLRDCLNSGSVNCSYRCGGIIGYLKEGSASYGVNTAPVSSGSYCGGVVGYLSSDSTLTGGYYLENAAIGGVGSSSYAADTANAVGQTAYQLATETVWSLNTVAGTTAYRNIWRSGNQSPQIFGDHPFIYRIVLTGALSRTEYLAAGSLLTLPTAAENGTYRYEVDGEALESPVAISQDLSILVAFIPDETEEASPTPTSSYNEEIDILSARFSSSSVTRGKAATMQVTTTPDVVKLNIYNAAGEPMKINSLTKSTKNGTITWRAKVVITGRVGVNTFTAYGVDLDGRQSLDHASASIRVSLR